MDKKKITVRLTEKQDENINEAAIKTGRTKSDLIRDVIENYLSNQNDSLQDFTKKTDRKNKLLREKIRQENQIYWLFMNVTNNINQIAKYINLNKNSADHKQLLSAFNEMKKQINQVEQIIKNEVIKE